MTPDPPRVASWTSVAEMVDGPFRHTHHSAVAVTDGQGRGIGLVTMQDVRRLPAEQWSSTTAAQLMACRRPADGARPGGAAGRRRGQRIDPARGGYAVVVADGALVGLLGPDEVRRAIEVGRPAAVPGAGHTAAAAGSVPSQRWEPPVTRPLSARPSGTPTRGRRVLPGVDCSVAA